MGATETAVVYFAIGAAVGAAAASKADPRWLHRIGAFIMSALLWPVFVPFILHHPRPTRRHGGPDEERIAAAEARLVGALEKLDGVAEEVLAPELARVRRLGDALRGMARRAGEMERLLAGPELSRARAERTLEELLAQSPRDDDPRTRSVRARLANIDRLESMKTKTLFALERALLEVEEIGSRMVLLEFADRPEEELLQMIREIADSVDVSEGALAT